MRYNGIMPNYGSAQPGSLTPPSLNIAALYPGDGLYFLFNAEAPAAGQASVVFERAQGPAMVDQGTTFEINFSAAPTDSIQILGSNNPNLQVFTAADWFTLYTSANKQTDAYTDTGRFRFYCVLVASLTPGPTLTVTAKR